MAAKNQMTREELRRMLDAGAGRAILFLMDRDLSNYRDIIRDACLRNGAYDRQVEPTRAHYLHPLIRRSGEEHYYRLRILDALLAAKDPFDADQLLDFAVIFAREGDRGARDAIYEKLRVGNTDEALQGASHAVEMDGVDGLVRALEIIGSDSALLAEHTDDYIIRVAEEASSVDEVRLALQRAASESPSVAAALAGVPDYSPYWSPQQTARRRDERTQSLLAQVPAVAADARWEEVHASPDFERIASRWSQVASPEEFERAARSIDPSDEPRRLRTHLSLFRRRPFPLEPGPLIRLVDHPDRFVGIVSIAALEVVRHSEVRDLFERLSSDPEKSDRSIRLLRSNYRSEDHMLLLRLLEGESDPDRLHTMCMGIKCVYLANPVPEGLAPLVAAYERTPCSLCRCGCVEAIWAIGAVPGWMIEECAWDVYSETRELAAVLRQDR